MAAVLEAVSTAINAELGPKGIVAFPTHAPRLVELDVTEIRPSSTTRYVNEFVLEHESSAIGLAGSRARASPSPEVRFARELLRDLRWEFERSTTGKGTVKVLSFFEGGAERGYKYKNRAMTRADLVGAIRELLRTFAAQPNRERMVVCVDELDESVDVLKARATGFPPILATLCHAWTRDARFITPRKGRWWLCTNVREFCIHFADVARQ